MILIGFVIFYIVLWIAGWNLMIKRIPMPTYLKAVVMALLVFLSLRWPSWEEANAAKDFHEKTCTAEYGVKTFNKASSADGITFESQLFSDKRVQEFLEMKYFNYVELNDLIDKKHYQLNNGKLVVSDGLVGSDLHLKEATQKIGDNLIYSDYVIYSSINKSMISRLRIPVFLGGFVRTHFLPMPTTEYCNESRKLSVELKLFIQDLFKK